MKIKNIKNVETFLEVVNGCKGEVTLTSVYGDKYNLKSALTQYVACLMNTQKCSKIT